jgi:hypothetical protein
MRLGTVGIVKVRNERSQRPAVRSRLHIVRRGSRRQIGRSLVSRSSGGGSTSGRESGPRRVERPPDSKTKGEERRVKRPHNPDASRLVVHRDVHACTRSHVLARPVVYCLFHAESPRLHLLKVMKCMRRLQVKKFKRQSASLWSLPLPLRSPSLISKLDHFLRR